jgi:glucose/arabinose dehydrogenase
MFGVERFDQPVALVPRGEGFLVVEQAGRVWEMKEGRRSLFLDVREKVRTDNPEEGLLSLAFHPKDPGRFYVIYSVKGAKPRTTRLSERQAGAQGERVLLELTKRWGNHNGSTLAFGPEGNLYVSLGDGGGGGDTMGNAQKLGSLLGKVLRIDVDHRDPGLEYSVPKGNPFVGKAGARGEIWAYGLRNPWRMSYDPASGALWAGDVGQDRREEIDVIRAGGNYGWNFREGTRAFKGKAPRGAALVEPVWDYGRDQGFCVTGGVVGGEKGPAWARGRYVFADFGSRRLWTLKADPASPGKAREEGRCPEAPASFARGAGGELYLVGYEGGIFRLN